MNRIAPSKAGRGWLSMMLIIASMRVFAGIPELEIGGQHASEGVFGLVAEHSYDVSHGDDAPGTHLHCHNCCAHAPMAVSSTVLPQVMKAPIVRSVVSIPVTTAPTFAHFRPPRT